MAHYEVHHANCFEWLREQQTPLSIHAVCTDPPFGIVEFLPHEMVKLRNGRGGVWRIPPSIGGSQRAPLPRFTTLNQQEREHVRVYFREFGEALMPALIPGAHVFLAGTPMLQHLVQSGMAEAIEEAVSDHPTLKPQHLLRILTRSLLPLGKGQVLDPFCGSGSTLAACQAVGYDAIGIEVDDDYFASLHTNIRQLSGLYPKYRGETLEMLSDGVPVANGKERRQGVLL